jgi:hypothetical protein
VKPLVYHAGQRAAQEEAGTVRVADKLADWTGPAVEFARGADLFVFALPDAGGALRFAVLSGEPPLVEATVATISYCACRPSSHRRWARRPPAAGLRSAWRARRAARERLRPLRRAAGAAGNRSVHALPQVLRAGRGGGGGCVGPSRRQPVGLDDPGYVRSSRARNLVSREREPTA